MKVCFVAWQGYSVLNPRAPGPIGGMESRAVFLAQRLARRPGFDVSFLSADCGQPDGEQIDGITSRVYPFLGSERLAVLNRIRVRHYDIAHAAGSTRQRVVHRAASLALAAPIAASFIAYDLLSVVGRVNPLFRSLGADVYVAFGVNFMSAEVVSSARRYGARSVVAVASDLHLLDSYAPWSWRLNADNSRAGACWLALHNADAIMVQNETQKQLLKERFGRDGTLIRNPVEFDDVPPPATAGEHLLWIGRADNLKRPALLLDLAVRCPEIPFVMIMNDSDERMGRDVRARLPPNVRLIPKVPVTEIDAYFRSARALVNTSRVEGMPNTFLQAAKHGRPVLSLAVDPENMLERSGGGLVARESVERLAEQAHRVWADAAQAQAMGARLREHVRQFHDADARVDELERMLRSLAPQ